MPYLIQSFRIASWALLAAMACLPATPAIAEKRVALVIGNDRYVNMGADRQLKKAVNDANTVAAAMSRALGFDVLIGTDLGHKG